MFVDGMCDTKDVSRSVIAPLVASAKTKNRSVADPFDYLSREVLPECLMKKATDFETVTNDMLSGDTVLFIDGFAGALMLDTKGYSIRSISEPPTSGSVRGPREGFIEDFKTNVIMLRRKIRSPKLKVDMLKCGTRTQTNVAVVYLSDVADADVVDKVTKKINDIDIDGILDSSYIASFLEDRRGSVFPQVGRSEKPDVVASKLLEGRVAVVVDGSPFVLTVPFMIIEELQAIDDYYEKPTVASISRLLRFFALSFAILLPGLYVCIQKFNYQVIPAKFLMTIMNSVENIPLGPLVEMLTVIFLFDMLQEANVRMPRTAGLALNVVGALVLGDAAIKAGLISAPAVLIGALNGIGLYAMPDELKLFSMLRWVFTLLGGLMGTFGLMMGLMFLTTYLVSLDTYGTPYLAPYAPLVKNDLQDGFFKTNLLNARRRPDSIPNKNKVRIGEVLN
jgi:spore germination protein KA